MILEKFYGSEFDNQVILRIRNDKEITFSELKKYVYFQYLRFKNIDKSAVVLFGDNSFEFVVNFFASLFSEKEIYLLTDKNRLSSLNIDYILPTAFDKCDDFSFPQIDEKKSVVKIFTSGSTGTPKTIVKSFENLENESKGIVKQFDFVNGTDVFSTTIMSHMFGLTFHFMLPLYCGLVINTEKIEFPEQITENKPYILVSSPSFLEKMAKYDINFSYPPHRIITAGDKLKDYVHNYFVKKSDIIEIYGSSETGVIAFRNNTKNFRKFDVVEINTDENDCIVVKSDFFMEKEIKMEDVIKKLSDCEFELKGRSDRLVKIKEKRVSLVELETSLKKHQKVSDAYCFKYEDILACVVVTNDFELTKKELKEYLSRYSDVVPKKWRFLDEIPKTITGKIDKTKLEQIFGMNLSFPFILERRQNGNCIELDMIFKKSSNFFNGHFPQIPVLAGVVQLFYANWFTNDVFKIDIAKEEAKRVKFTNIIRADDKVTLKLTNNDKNVEFAYFADDKVYSSGIFVK